MSKPVAKSAAAKKATSTGPSYEAMIKDAIISHPEESRAGLSRPTIKKYVLQKYPATSKLSEASFSNHISKAIAKGAEKKVFSLPKGPSGKVKLAPSVKKAPAAKKPAATKKPATKKPATKVKKTTTTTAKKPVAKKTKSSTATKAKKPAAKVTKKVAPKKKAVAKKA